MTSVNRPTRDGGMRAILDQVISRRGQQPAGAQERAPHAFAIGEAGLWGAAILTLFTGYDYLRTGLAHMTGAPVGVERAQRAKPQAQPRIG